MINSASFLLLLLVTPNNAYCKLENVPEVLPLYPPSLVVTDSDGDLLIKRAAPDRDFAKMEVRIAYVSLIEKKSWSPRNLQEAAFALREVLPNDYYERLLKIYTKDWTLTDPLDLPVFSRTGDVADFLKEKWGMGWTTQKNPEKALFELVKYSRRHPPDPQEKCEH